MTIISRTMPRKRSAGLPSRKQILDFIASSDQPAGKREIARAFGLSGQDKIDLKRLLKDMADEGLIDSAPGRAFHKSGGVPKVTVLRVQAATSASGASCSSATSRPQRRAIWCFAR
jgi:ribonuclease R